MNLVQLASIALVVAVTAAKKAQEVELSANVGQQNGFVSAPLPLPLQMVKEAALGGKQSIMQRETKGLSFRKIGDSTVPGGRTVRVQQHYHGIEVFGYGVVVHEVSMPEVQATLYNGMMATGLEDVVQEGDFERLSALQQGVFEKVKRRMERVGTEGSGFTSDVLKDGVQPMIYVHLETKEITKGFLVKFMDTTNPEPSFPNIFTDEEGNVVDQYEGLKTNKVARGHGYGGNKKIGKKFRKFDVTDLENGRCLMKSPQVITVDLKHRRSNKNKRPHEFNCYRSLGREVNGGYAPVNDAQEIGKLVYNMYKWYFGVSPLKDLPFYLKAHFSFRFQNAYWDGEAMTFGDGADQLYPLTSTDVIAHEVSHGVTEQSSNLAYRYQPGGLDEAFSDMAGKTAEAYERGYSKAKFQWGVGYEISKPGLGRYRCMNNPPCDGRSIDDVRNYTSGMNPHYTSGVFNKVFYLVSKDSKNNLHDAFDVFYTANTKYWSRRTIFRQAAGLTLKALAHIKKGMHNFPKGKHDHIKEQTYVDAFADVGISCKKGAKYDEYKCKDMEKDKFAGFEGLTKEEMGEMA